MRPSANQRKQASEEKQKRKRRRTRRGKAEGEGGEKKEGKWERRKRRVPILSVVKISTLCFRGHSLAGLSSRPPVLF